MERAQLLFSQLWQDYITRLCPSAEKVQQLLTEDDPLMNDHIALRTYNLPRCGLDRVAAAFIAVGYEPKGQYKFEEKKLYAEHFEHPNPVVPKVFISELQLGQCSSQLQLLVRKLLDQVPHGYFSNSMFLSQGRPWTLSYQEYQMLAQESEYAAWVAAHGFGANHFTVSINPLEQFTEVAEVNHYLTHNGFAINQAGGAVKGSAALMLEQSSTMADKVMVEFSDGKQLIPGGFYEFAKRYPMANGDLFSGFVEASANRIFESTYQNNEN
ncbi:TPA: DUF1338 domain-containing protein [Photobacterium damselae]